MQEFLSRTFAVKVIGQMDRLTRGNENRVTRLKEGGGAPALCRVEGMRINQVPPTKMGHRFTPMPQTFSDDLAKAGVWLLSAFNSSQIRFG